MGPSSAPMRRPLDHRAALGRPYLVASALGAAAAAVARSAPGLEPIDPMRGGSGRFLDRLERLRGLVDDATGRVMPKWVFYDCGEVPGAIVGLTRPARDLDRQTLALLGGVDDPAELVPVSMLIALPMLRPGWWHLYALGAAGPEDADEQRSVTVSLTLAALAVETATAALPWRSAALDAFARAARLRLVTSWTPAHSEPRTATVRFAAPRSVVTAGDGPASWLDVDDDDALRAVQDRLEAGAAVEITGPPQRRDGRLLAPLREVTP